jgi:hypothetical protein
MSDDDQDFFGIKIKHDANGNPYVAETKNSAYKPKTIEQGIAFSYALMEFIAFESFSTVKSWDRFRDWVTSITPEQERAAIEAQPNTLLFELYALGYRDYLQSDLKA